MATSGTPGKGWVYLLHLSAPIGTDKQAARHYLGWAEDVERRLWEHRAGAGARFTRAAVKRGVSLYLARTWPGTRELERIYKQWHGPYKLCPMCKEASQEQEAPTLPDRPATLWEGVY